MKYVPGYGCSTAKLVVVGEAPGAHEENEGLPFVGPSGKLLDQCLEFAGINRSYVYLTNVVKVRPPNNEIDKLSLIGHTIEEFIPQLREELSIINPNCILALGKTAWHALTGLTGIQHYRGSILQSSLTGHKVVATLHPASLLHQTDGSETSSWRDFTFIKADTKRAYEQSLFRDYRPPSRNLHIAYNSLDVIRFLERHQNHEMAAVDVETFKTWVQCVGIAFTEYEALCIPTFWDQIPSNDKVYIWRLLAEFFQDTKIKIIAQNAKFDQKKCRQIGLAWSKCWFSMDMGWHTLHPEFPKKLEFIASLITEEPYWKDEGKEYNPKLHDIKRWFLYNAKDAAVEYECADKILKELKDLNLYEFFFDKVQPLYEIYYDIEDVGILVDLEIRKHLREKYKDLQETIHNRLIKNIANGDPNALEAFKDFNVMSNGPKNQVAKLLFGYLKLPVRKDTGDDTLKSLANNNVKEIRIKEILMDILAERKVRKTIGTYVDAKLSPKNRCYTTCNLNGTETYRTSTGILKPPVSQEKMGIALQTMTKHDDAQLESSGGADLRSMFISDPGFNLVESDGSQAEDRVVCVLAKDWQALEDYKRVNFKKNKYGIKDDRHTQTAMSVCSMGFDEITDYQRQIGKKTRHAGNYAMKKHMHMLNLAKFGGVYISEFQAGKQLERFHETNPKIRGVFHKEIQDTLRSNYNTLVAPHGYERQFFNIWGDDLFKEAYAFIPQCTVSTQTRLAMLGARRRLEKWYKKLFFFVLESHDSSTALVHDDILDEYIVVINEEMERPINFKKCSLSRDYDLVISAETKVGKRWVEYSKDWPDGMKKYEKK